MAASGYTPISLYYSTTASATPLAANLVSGELAINIADGKLFYKDSGGTVQTLATKSSSISPITNNGVVYVNSSGQATSGSALTFDGTNLGVGLSSNLSGLNVNGALRSQNNSSNISYIGFTAYTGTSTAGAMYSYIGGDGRSGGYLNFSISDAEQMRLTSTGLGIGTSSPGYKLDVNGTSNFSGNMNLTATSNINWNGGDVAITNSGTNLIFKTYSSGSLSEKMRLDSSGNLGLGVTPSNAYSGIKAFEFGANGTLMSETPSSVYNAIQLGVNFYYNAAGDLKYKSASVAASRYVQYQGQHLWYYAPVNSGSAGAAITFTQAMTLDASGNLGIGTSSPSYKLTIDNSSGNYYPIAMTSGSIGTAGNYVGMRFGYSGSTYQKAAIIFQSADGNGRGTMHFSLDGNVGSGNADISTSKMQLDYSGNLGLGVTPSAWLSNRRAFEIGGKAANVLGFPTIGQIYYNAYLDSSSTHIYKANGYAGTFDYNYAATGGFVWNLAPSGTAGNAISFTQAMTLDASGNLLVGTTSSSYSAAGRGVIEVNGGSTAIAALKVNGSGVGYTYHDGTAMSVWNVANGNLLFGTNNTERARIDSSGYLLVGTTSAGSSGVGPLILNKATNPGYVVAYNGTESAYQYMPSSTRYRGETITGVAIEFSAGNSNGVSLASGGTSWGSLSDERKKDIIEPITDAANKVSTLRAVIGKYKTDDESTRRSFLIAQDVQAVLPEAVVEDQSGDLILQYTETIPLLVAAIKEQQAQIESLRKRLADAGIA